MLDQKQPQPRIDCSAEEWEARVDLACAYRLFDRFGWHSLIYNHITLRIPGPERHFLINPFGLMYREVTASNLIKVDLDRIPHLSAVASAVLGFHMPDTITKALPKERFL